MRKPEYLSPAQLARGQGCSERTVREWCKRGFIEEAYQTKGGHWRIRTPLSGKTLLELEKRHKDSLLNPRNRYSSHLCFKKARDLHGEWVPDFAEWLMLAQLYQCRLGDEFPVPTIAELGGPLWEGFESTDPRAKMARQIQDEIMQRLETRKPFWDMLVLGWVYQLSRENQRLPTLAKVAERVWLNRPALYRKKCSAKEIAKAYQVAIGELRRDLPGSDQLDSAQRANRKANKPPQLWKPRAADRVRNSKKSSTSC
jgi:helix-turn-helix protein